MSSSTEQLLTPRHWPCISPDLHQQLLAEATPPWLQPLSAAFNIPDNWFCHTAKTDSSHVRTFHFSDYCCYTEGILKRKLSRWNHLFPNQHQTKCPESEYISHITIWSWLHLYKIGFCSFHFTERKIKISRFQGDLRLQVCSVYYFPLLSVAASSGIVWKGLNKAGPLQP